VWKADKQRRLLRLADGAVSGAAMDARGGSRIARPLGEAACILWANVTVTMVMMIGIMTGRPPANAPPGHDDTAVRQRVGGANLWASMQLRDDADGGAEHRTTGPVVSAPL
jgi:hypothetical protein